MATLPMLFFCLLADLFACSAALTKHSQHRMSKSMSEVSKMRRGEDGTDVMVDMSTGAACLDGSPFYFTYYPGTSNRWTIELHPVGVGCFDFQGVPEEYGGAEDGGSENCAVRALDDTGSSVNVTTGDCDCRNFDEMGNNDSCHCVSLLNCDGSMLGGYLEDAVEFGGKKYYSRGRRNLNATLEKLLEEYGLSDASDVVLTGVSGAGAAMIVALEAARAIIPESVAVSGLSIGGFISEWDDAKTDYMYLDELKRMFEFHAMQDQIPSACLDEHVSEEYLCLLAPYAVKHIKTPLFFLNSHYDAWQLVNLDASEIEREDLYENMSGVGKDHDKVEEYGANWLSQFEAALTSDTPHGAFITSCMCHCLCGPNATEFMSWDDAKTAYISWYFNQVHNVYIDPDEANYQCNGGVLP